MSVRHAILGLLAQEPCHGYELHGAFQALVGGKSNWDLKPAQVYSTLSRLEEAGLVRQTAVRRVGGPDQRVYELTEAGYDELLGWFASGVHAEHQRDEYFVKLQLALVTDGVDPHAVIRTQRTLLYRTLHELNTRRAHVASELGLAQAMLVDKAVMHVEADVRWLDMVEARLAEMAAAPLPRPEARRRGRPPKETGPP